MRVAYHFLSLALCAAVALPTLSQDATNENYPVLGEIVRLDPALDALLDADAKIQVLATGFEWTEGPVWVPDGQYLLFNDIPRNSTMKWKKGEGVSVFLKPSGYTGAVDYGSEPGANGMFLDKDGHVLFCEHGDRRVSILTREGGKRTLVDNYNGKRLNSPNDLVVHSSGAIYFTDPPYGLPERENDSRRELEHFGVYRLTSSGELTLLTDKMTRPNGIAFSPDEKTLYVAQSDPAAAIWNAFPVKEDGTLGEAKLLHDATGRVNKDPGLPDGMCVDKLGNIWATGPGGVWIFDPNGKVLGKLATKERTANCTFGDDGSTLYITADMYLCRIRTKTKGIGF